MNHSYVKNNIKHINDLGNFDCETKESSLRKVNGQRVIEIHPSSCHQIKVNI